MNALINVKTAEKGLRFGHTKCKTMVVGKNTESVVTNPLVVDNWKTDYVPNQETGEATLTETYKGKIEIEPVLQQKYLGFVISNQNNNMANIQEVKKKSIGITRKLLEKLNSLKLKKYYFECGLIFMNVILRGSILYASETYYNLKKKKRKRKGNEIIYSELQMADYLLPNENIKSIEDQRYLFAIRNKMINIPTNFGKYSNCKCGENEDMAHIYNCNILNKKEEKIEFEKIYNGNLTEKGEILKRFRNNMKNREITNHEIGHRSTNFCKDFSNGNI